MKKTLVAAVFAVTLAVAPALFAQENGGGVGPDTHGAEHAAAANEHGEHQAEAEMPNEIWWKWANFALLVAGLGYLISKKAPEFFRSRTEMIQRGIAESALVRQQAEARAAEIEQRVANLAAEVEQMRVRSREEIAREGERIRLDTDAAMRKIQAQSRAEIESAVKHAVYDLKAWSAQLALEMAEQQIRSRMSQSEQDQLATTFVSELRQRAETH